MIIIFSGPSGVGKSTIINELLNHISLYFSISHTTRKKRNNEINGKDYYFISLNEFNKLIEENYFIEYEKYGIDYYGTSKEQLINDHKITVLDLEVNGASKLLDENEDLRYFVNLYLNNEDVRFLDGLSTSVKSGDEVSIVPAVAGGC